MPRMRTKEGQTDIQQTTFSPKFAIIEPGVYLARVSAATQATFVSNGGQKYLKIRPVVTLFNENGTEISNQDLIVGAVDENDVLFQPDEKKRAEGVSPVWSEALFFMASLGFEDVEDFAVELVTGQIVVVSVVTEEYTSKNGQSGKKNVVGYRRSNGKTGGGFFAVNEERHADWIKEHDLFQKDGAWWVDENDYDAYQSAMEKLDEEDDEPVQDDDIL